ncbi:HTH_48 domain-containing protein [Trichonephila clavipes]|nr:HTH_48 domain-containing protein [Trichonephila clavipes]
MDKIEYRAVVKYFFLKGNTPTQIKEEVDSVYGDSAPSFTTVKFWAAKFKRGRKSLGGVEQKENPVSQRQRPVSHLIGCHGKNPQITSRDSQRTGLSGIDTQEYICTDLAADETWLLCSHTSMENDHMSRSTAATALPSKWLNIINLTSNQVETSPGKLKSCTLETVELRYPMTNELHVHPDVSYLPETNGVDA